MTQYRTPTSGGSRIVVDPAHVLAPQGPGAGAWMPASPGTGGNIQSVALEASNSAAMWVGSDNAGMMRGSMSPGTWTFSGAQSGIDSPDIGDVTAVDLTTGTLVYTVAGGALGPAGGSERLALYVRQSIAKEWTNVSLDVFDHLWLDKEAGPPRTDTWPGALNNEQGPWFRTEAVRFLAPSMARAFAFPGGTGRHILVLGGNNGSRQYSDGNIYVPKNAPDAWYKPFAKLDREVLPHDNPPTFYVCLARLSVGKYEHGNWIGATYLESRAVWPDAEGPPNQAVEKPDDIYVNYDRRSGIGCMWLDPTARKTSAGMEVQVYFTIRFGTPKTPDAPPKTEDETERAREYHLVRLTVTVPDGDSLELPVPTSKASPEVLRFDRLLSVDSTSGLGQVAGIRDSGILRLIYTAPAAPVAECIRRLDETAPDSGVFGPPVIEDIDTKLVEYYGPKTSASLAPPASGVIVKYGNESVGTFFFVETSPLGWAYVAASKGAAGTIHPGLWSRSPADGAWSRLSFLIGDAPGPSRAVQLRLKTALAGKAPIQVAVGVVVDLPFEGTPVDGQRLVATVRFYGKVGRGSPSSVGPAQYVYLDPFTDGEQIGPVHWGIVELGTSPNQALGDNGGIEVQISCRAVIGEAAVQVVARAAPVGPDGVSGSCPLDPPPMWTHRLTGWEPNPANAPWIQWEALGDAPVAHVNAQKAGPQIAPNMHREDTWRSARVTGGDDFECLAVAAGPSAAVSGAGHRILVGRGDSQLFYSNDNGTSFLPLGSQKAGSMLVGSADEETQEIAPTWSTTGLETMWMFGFHVAAIPAGALGVTTRLFNFTNDGGLFFSDDGGVSWAFAQPNVPKARMVPTVGDEKSRIVDITAMASRAKSGKRELLLATTTVSVNDPRAGRVVLSRDGGWTWTGRAFCGLPEGAIWALAEAGNHVYATVGGHGVYLLTSGTYEWTPTGGFAYEAELGATVAVPTGTTEFTVDTRTLWRSTLNPQHLAVVRDGLGTPKWLIAGLVIDGHNRGWNDTSLIEESVNGAGLWRLKLTSAGLPAAGATWEQIGGLHVPSSFPNAWRAMTGLAWDGKSGVVVSLEESAATGGGQPWFEGAVLWCDDVGALRPVFRLVLCHPKPTAIAMSRGRLFVGLGLYDRIGFFGTTSSIAAWQEKASDPLHPAAVGAGFDASSLYYSPPDGADPSKRSASVGIFEVRRQSSGSFLALAPSLKDFGYMQQIADLVADGAVRVDQFMKFVGQDGGWLSPGAELVDLTGALVQRNLVRPLALQVVGERLIVGLMGSGSWSRAI